MSNTRRLLLTGGTGFLGGHIINHLDVKDYQDRYNFDVLRLMVRNKTKAEKIKITHVEYEIVEGDLLDKDSLKRAAQDVEIVMHVAAVFDASSSKKAFYSANVDGTRALLEVLDEGSKFILTSTFGVYGLDTPKEPISEDYQPRKPFWHYQKSKAEQENLTFELGKQKNIEVVAIRPPTVTGPGDYYFFPTLIEALRSGDVVYLRDNGANVLTMGHVADIAKAHVLALEDFDKAKGQAFNVQSFARPFRELIEGIRERMSEIEETKEPRRIPYWFAYTLAWMSDFLKLPLPLNRFSVKFLGSYSDLDTTKIEETLGWKSEYNMDKTLDESWEWYKKHTPKPRA